MLSLETMFSSEIFILRFLQVVLISYFVSQMSSILQVKYKMLLDALNKRAAEGEVIEFKESVSTLFQKY